MESDNKMPLTFQMALAHNTQSMSTFLKMSNEKQDEIIKEATKLKTVREMQNFVDSIPKTN